MRKIKSTFKFSSLILAFALIFFVPSVQAGPYDCSIDYPTSAPGSGQGSDTPGEYNSCCWPGPGDPDEYRGVDCPSLGKILQDPGNGFPYCVDEADIFAIADSARQINRRTFNCVSGNITGACRANYCKSSGTCIQQTGISCPAGLNRQDMCPGGCGGCNPGFVYCPNPAPAGPEPVGIDPNPVFPGSNQCRAIDYGPDPGVQAQNHAQSCENQGRSLANPCTGECTACRAGFTTSGRDLSCITFAQRFMEIFQDGLTPLGGLAFDYVGAGDIQNTYIYGSHRDPVNWMDANEAEFFGGFVMESDQSDHLNWNAITTPPTLRSQVEATGIELCQTVAECSPGQVCLAGMCVNPGGLPGNVCTTSSDCAPGLLCIANECVDVNSVYEVECSNNTDCTNAGLAVPPFACLSGLCRNDSDPVNCNNNNECPAGLVCIGNLCTAPPAGSETDPQVNTLNPGEWCATDPTGSFIDCNLPAPSGGSDSDWNEVISPGHVVRTIGNVGIGIAVPTYKLHTIGSARITGSTAIGATASAPGLSSVAMAGGNASGISSAAIAGGNSSGSNSVAMAGGISSAANSVAIAGGTSSGTSSVSIGTVTARASGSVAIGRFIDILPSATNSVGIGVSSSGLSTISDSNVVAIMGGEVGIGTSSPSRLLHVAGDIQIDGNCFGPGCGGPGTSPWSPATPPNSIHYGTGGTGTVGVGTDVPIVNLDVRGAGRFGSPDTIAATGLHSFAAGIDNAAPGESATAFGEANNAQGRKSIAIGDSNSTSSIATGSAAIGILNSTSQDGAIAMGIGSTASDYAAIAAGAQAQATGFRSLAFGNLAQSTDNYATAIGNSATATQDNSVAIGNQSSATALWGMSFGRLATASGNSSTALGYSSIASGTESVAVGEITVGADNAVGIGLGSGPNGHHVDDTFGVRGGDSIFQTDNETGVGLEDGEAIVRLYDPDSVVGKTKGLAFSRHATDFIVGGIEPFAVTDREADLDLYTTYDRCFGEPSVCNRTLNRSMRLYGAGGMAVGQGTDADGYISYAFGDRMTVASSAGRSFGINLSTTPQTLSDAGTMAILGGEVGIGTNSPQRLLHVAGDIQIDGNCFGPGCSGGGGLWSPNGSDIAYVAGTVGVGVGSGFHAYTDFVVDTESSLGAVRFGKHHFDERWGNVSIGQHSFATGFDNQVSGTVSAALGHTNQVHNQYSVAVGRNNIIPSGGSGGSFAAGWTNTSSGRGSVAMGHTNTASGNESMAFGFNNQATASQSVAIGRDNSVSREFSAALGVDNTISQPYSYAIGEDITLTGRDSVGLGHNLTVSGDNSFGINVHPFNSATVASDGVIAFLGGNVGINTSSPLVELEVNGSIRGNQSGALRVQTPSGWTDFGSKNSSWSHFSTDRPRYYFDKEIRVDSGQIGSYDEDLTLRTAGTDRLSIESSTGDVGIGTTNPDRELTIQRSGAAYMNVKDGTRELLMGVDGAGGIVSTMTNHNLELRTNNTPRVVLGNNGGVTFNTSATINSSLDTNGILRANGGIYLPNMNVSFHTASTTHTNDPSNWTEMNGLTVDGKDLCFLSQVRLAGLEDEREGGDDEAGCRISQDGSVSTRWHLRPGKEEDGDAICTMMCVEFS